MKGLDYYMQLIMRIVIIFRADITLFYQDSEEESHLNFVHRQFEFKRTTEHLHLYCVYLRNKKLPEFLFVILKIEAIYIYKTI